MTDRKVLYNKLVAAYKALHESHVEAQMSAVEYWNTVKSEKDELNFEVLINDKIAELKKQTMKRKGSIFSYWGNIKKKNVDNNTEKVVSISNPIVNENEISSSTPSSPTNNDLEILTPTQTTQSTSILVTSATESSSRKSLF